MKFLMVAEFTKCELEDKEDSQTGEIKKMHRAYFKKPVAILRDGKAEIEIKEGRAWSEVEIKKLGQATVEIELSAYKDGNRATPSFRIKRVVQ